MKLHGRQKDFIDLVEAGEKHILVEAPAGTGKTFCCIQAARTIWNHRMIRDYQKTLVLTFSRNARAQLVRELMKIPEEEGLARHVDITNYHSFFKKYLDAYRDLLGIEPPLTVIDNESFDELLLQYAHKKHIMIPTKLSCQALDDFSFMSCSEICVNPQSDYRKVATADIQKYYDDTTAFSQQTGYIAFSQFGSFICKALSLSPYMVKAICHDYPILILDEYQDTNYYQEIFVSAITKYSRCIFFADSLQMIYGFRGSSATRIRDLFIKYPDIKTVEFDEYYRYKDKPDLITVLTAIRNKIPVDYSALQNGGLILCSCSCDSNWEVIKGRSHTTQCTILCKSLYYRIIKGIIEFLKSQKSVVILCRTNDIANRLAEVFFDNDLHPRSVSDTPDLLSLSRALKQAIDPDKCLSEKIPIILSIAVLCTANKQIAGESYADLSVLTAQSLSRKKKPLLKEIYMVTAPILQSKTVDDICLVITQILELLKAKNCVAISNARKRFVDHCLSTQELSAQTIDNIMLQRQYVDSFTTINPGLYITTVHQSKGKEFDCVYVVDVGSLANDYNLLYVSHSRMKEKLYPIQIRYTGVQYR